jgi:catechol-2,3-dioxygenase
MRSHSSLIGVVVLWFVVIPHGATAQEALEPWIPEILAPQFFAVLVEDVDVSVAWYRHALGLQELDDSEAEDGSWRIVNLHSEQLLVEIIRDARASEVERARGLFKVGFRVENVEQVADRVERATGERPRVVDFDAHGVRILQLRDPDGNRIQLTSPLEDRPQEQRSNR